MQQRYRPSQSFGESVTVTGNGNVRRLAPSSASHGSLQPLSYVEQLEQRIAQLEQFVYKMDAIAEQRIKDQNTWAKQIVDRADYEAQCFNNHLDHATEFASGIYAWQNKFQEKFETTDALVHDVASHLFPKMKHFVDDVNEACAKPLPPVKPVK